MDIIRQLWYGNVRPIADGKQSKKMRELERLMGVNIEKLEKLLDEKGKDRLGAYTGIMDEYMLDYGEHAFYKGFCLGVTLTALAMSERQDE
jgi:hypothetical protein